MHEDTWHLVSKVKYYMDSGSVSSITIQKGKNIVYWLIVVEKTMAINQKAVWFIHLCMLIRELARNSIAGLDHEYDVNILLCRDCTVSCINVLYIVQVQLSAESKVNSRWNTRKISDKTSTRLVVNNA